MTLNMYLNTVPSSCGGATRFMSPPGPEESGADWSKYTVQLAVQPVLGSALLFRDDVWHDGEEVTKGVKYLLRTDVMYWRQKPIGDGLKGFEAFCEGKSWGDEERARKMLSFAEALEDAKRSEDAVRYYKMAFRLWPALERGG